MTPSVRARARPRARAMVISLALLSGATNCLGLGHPNRICPTPPGQGKGKAGAETCENCKGKGHGKRACTSKGSGQYTDPSLGKRPGQWGQGKGQGQWGQGKGKQGKGKGWAKERAKESMASMIKIGDNMIGINHRLGPSSPSGRPTQLPLQPHRRLCLGWTQHKRARVRKTHGRPGRRLEPGSPV